MLDGRVCGNAGGPGSMLAVGIDSDLRQCMIIYEYVLNEGPGGKRA